MNEYKRLKRLVESYKYKVDIELYNLCWKEKRDSVDVAKFTELRKFKYWDNRIKKTAWEFFSIRKQHTQSEKSKLVWSWKECVMKFHYAWYNTLDHDDFEWFKVPFTPYHQSVVDCDIVKIIWIRWKFEKDGKIYYICSWEYQWMWLITNGPLEEFNGLMFSDFGSIDFIEKDWKFIDQSWEWKAYQICRSNKFMS